MAWTQQEINNCIAACKRKAAVDAAFRKQLLADPATARKSRRDSGSKYWKTTRSTMRHLFFRRRFRVIFQTRNLTA